MAELRPFRVISSAFMVALWKSWIFFPFAPIYNVGGLACNGWEKSSTWLNITLQQVGNWTGSLQNMAENYFTSPMRLSYTEPPFQCGRKVCSTLTFMWVYQYTTSFPGEPQSQPVLCLLLVYLCHCVFSFRHLNQVIQHSQAMSHVLIYNQVILHGIFSVSIFNCICSCKY